MFPFVEYTIESFASHKLVCLLWTHMYKRGTWLIPNWILCVWGIIRKLFITTLYNPVKSLILDSTINYERNWNKYQQSADNFQILCGKFFMSNVFTMYVNNFSQLQGQVKIFHTAKEKFTYYEWCFRKFTLRQ